MTSTAAPAVRTRRVQGAFRTNAQMERLMGQTARHRLADGTFVTGTITGHREGYMVMTTAEGRTVRLDAVLTLLG